MTSDDAPARAASRRRFLRDASLVLAFSAGGTLLSLTPGQARARGLPFQLLSPAEVATLEALAEALVPGARDAGISHFLDQQLAAGPEDNLLMLKYLGIPPEEHAGFYRSALAGIDAHCRSRFGKALAGLPAAQTAEVVAALAGDDIPGWQGAPASLCFFVLRSDGADVVYGTAAGFEAIDMPYMAHIEAPAPW
jgi:Gluconate 2-dehydrogenase subunit 3